MRASGTGRSTSTRCPGRRAWFVSLLALVALAPAPAPSYAQWKSVLKQLEGTKQSGLTEGKIASGLKEALQVGTENTVKSTGRKDGYFGNPAIKILLPQKLKTMEQALRLMGKGPQLDDFVLSMNRAAEQAAPLAKPIFLDAVKQMTFQDARKILKGGNTAATDYFKEKTSAQLTEAFTPVVEKEMDKVGVIRRYNSLTGGMMGLSFGKSGAFDINRYVVSKSLAGLFYVLGQEETKIRTNPAAQITPLLKQVFGK